MVNVNLSKLSNDSWSLQILRKYFGVSGGLIQIINLNDICVALEILFENNKEIYNSLDFSNFSHELSNISFLVIEVSGLHKVLKKSQMQICFSNTKI